VASKRGKERKNRKREGGTLLKKTNISKLSAQNSSGILFFQVKKGGGRPKGNGKEQKCGRPRLREGAGELERPIKKGTFFGGNGGQRKTPSSIIRKTTLRGVGTDEILGSAQKNLETGGRGEGGGRTRLGLRAGQRRGTCQGNPRGGCRP